MTPAEEKFWIESAGGVYQAPAGATPLRESYGQAIDADEEDWRKLTADAGRDLPVLTQERMQKIAHWLWEQNPLANRIIELPVAYLLAEGVKLAVADPDNQKVLDRFWRDPINDMNVKLPKKVRELAIFGDQAYPAFVNEVDGMLRIAYLDPSYISEIVKDPDNAEQPIGLITKRDRKGNYRRYRIIINGPETVFTRRTQNIRAQFSDGELFYFSINDLSSGSRGRSDLLHQADWLDTYDQFLFGDAERYKHLKAFVWDLTLRNATADTVKQRARELVMPKDGGVYVHNDSETLEAKNPDLKSYDTANAARLLRNHMLGGASIPEHWFGGGGDVNRSTADSMGDPAFKVLAMRQRVWKHILESMGRYALLKAAAADGKNVDWGDPAWSPEAIFPELVAADLAGNATAMQQVVTACGLAIEKKLMTEKTALMLIGVVSGRLGVEIDAARELEEAKAEAAKRAEEDVFTTPSGAADGAAAGVALAAAKGVAAMQEAAGLLASFREKTEERFAALQAAAEAARQKPDPAEHFAEALAGALAEQGRHNREIVEALAAHSKRVELELTLKHGATKKTITLPDGSEMKLVEEPAGGA